MGIDSRQRRSGRTIIGLSAAIVLLAIAGWLRFELQSHRSLDRLVERARQMALRQDPRPPLFDDAEAGQFADALAALTPELVALHHRMESLDRTVASRCQKVRTGELPTSQLPAPCAEAVVREQALIARVLATAHTARGGRHQALWVSVGPTGAPDPGPGILDVSRLATEDLRLRLENGDREGAARLCVDGLAFARDVGTGEALIGAMVGAAITRTFFPACAKALDQGALALKRSVLPVLERLRRSADAPSRFIADEDVVSTLLACGNVLDDVQLARLPPRMKAIATSSRVELPPVVGRPTLEQACLRWEALQDEQVAAMDLPEPNRRARLEAIQQEAGRSWNPAVRLKSPDLEKFAVRDDQRRAELDLLIALVRVELERAQTGQWPDAAAATPQVFRPSAVHLERSGADLRLEIDVDGERKSVTATAPAG